MKTIIFFGADFFSTCFRLGYFPFAPGTMGSLVAVLGWIYLPDIKTLNLIFILLLIFTIGVFSTGFIERKNNVKDPSYIIIDECVGMWVALLFVPKIAIWLLTAFIIFRLFDIFKIYPVNRFEKLEGGLGIMSDDLIAGLYSGVITKAIISIT
ncbi:MAG: phosphatidylglycerophosphatase A [Candidatus Marinimicrobia bacterium]|nr:phosphatidylglycerophosphatase A [Candidatus Neomarinimicrobiota bacterium]